MEGIKIYYKYVKGVYILQYNIIDIVPENIDENKLKEIINIRLYRIIEMMEFNNIL